MMNDSDYIRHSPCNRPSQSLTLHQKQFCVNVTVDANTGTMLGRVLVFLLLVGDVRGQECPVGMYGDNCKLNCSRYCAPYDEQKVYCDKQSGKCSEGCIPGRYGDRCHLTCSRNCRNDICSFQTGHCAQGCIGNNTGDFCEISREPGPNQSERGSQDAASPPLVPTFVPVLVSVIIIIIIVAVTAPCMQRRKHHSKRSTDVECEVMLSPGRGPTDVECQEMLPPGRVDTDLHVACMDGKLKNVRDILDQSLEDIDKPGKGGMTPVMWAARMGHREMVDLLVKKGASLMLVDDVGNNILHWACYGGHSAMVKHVVSKNMVDTNMKGRDDRTPLMCAARQGIEDMFQLLVSKGGLPSHVDKDGNNTLLLACWGGNIEIVEYILSHDDVDINGRGQSGRTPLMGAAYKGHGKIFDLLVNKGADVNAVDDADDNVLHSACLRGHVDIVSRILKLEKVDINSRGQCGRTPLMMAARMGDREIFDLLVKEGADATPVDDDTNTILHLASEGGDVNIVKYALEVKNMDINGRNKRNETATMLASKGSDVCNLLVQRNGLIQ